MKLEVTDFLSEKPHQFMRRCSYSEYSDPNTGKTSFSRRLGSGFFPKFHIYIIARQPKGWIIDLHLDHKKHTYGNQTAHSGEYDGPLVTEELKRIYSVLSQL